MEPSINLTLTLDQAMAISQSISKTLAAEHRKFKRHAKESPIYKQAVENFQLLDAVDQDLREQIVEAIDNA